MSRPSEGRAGRDTVGTGYGILYSISRLWKGRYFPESRHIVDGILFHIALCASQFRVWNRYHIMTPVYVSVIYFCIRSLVRHPSNTSIGCFQLALFGKLRHWGQNECTSLIGWFFDMVYFQQWSATESKTPHVTLLVDCFTSHVAEPVGGVEQTTLLGISYWISYTHQIKIRQKKLRNLFTPSAMFFATKFHVFVIMYKATSEVFSSYQRNRTILSFRERYRLTVLYQTHCGYDGTERGFTKCDLIVTERTKLLFSLSEQ